MPTCWYFLNKQLAQQLDVAKAIQINKSDRTTDTFNNSQPGRVIGDPNRISRQAGVLPSVIKRHISQVEDFHFLVCGVKAGGLENNKWSRPNKRPKSGNKSTCTKMRYLSKKRTACNRFVAAGSVTRSSYLQDMNIRCSIRTNWAPVDLDVLQPLDVSLRVADHLALKLHIAAHHCGAISWQAGLQDRPVRRALCNTNKSYTKLVHMSAEQKSKHVWWVGIHAPDK